MAEVDALPQQVETGDLSRIGPVDLIAGIATFNNAQTIREVANAAVEGLTRLAASRRVALVHVDGGSKDDTPEYLRSAVAGRVPLLQLRYPVYPVYKMSAPVSGIPGRAQALETIFTAGEKLHARGGIVVESDVRSMTPDWVERLAAPLSDDYDVVWPLYLRQRFEGAINSGIVYPFMRALYGKNIRFPLSAGFGFSSRFPAASLNPATSNHQPSNGGTASLITRAIQNGLGICQTRLGPRVVEQKGTAPDVSATLAEALAPVFDEADQTAAFWQRIKRAENVPTFGTEWEAAPQPAAQVQTRRMIESYRLGHQDLQPIWGLVLPPATLVELKKLARLTPDEGFRLADETWARIIYDFALAYRLRTLARDHLLKALTPLYLAWVASFIGDVRDAGIEQVETRLEQLCLTFEAQKRYFISRWRWPDRFNP